MGRHVAGSKGRRLIVRMITAYGAEGNVLFRPPTTALASMCRLKEQQNVKTKPALLDRLHSSGCCILTCREGPFHCARNSPRRLARPAHGTGGGRSPTPRCGRGLAFARFNRVPRSRTPSRPAGPRTRTHRPGGVFGTLWGAGDDHPAKGHDAYWRADSPDHTRPGRPLY